MIVWQVLGGLLGVIIGIVLTSWMGAFRHIPPRVPCVMCGEFGPYENGVLCDECLSFVESHGTQLCQMQSDAEDEREGLTADSAPRGLVEVGETSRGYTIYREEDAAGGGYLYWSDAIGGAVPIWDTCLASVEELETAMRCERERVEAENDGRLQSWVSGD